MKRSLPSNGFTLVELIIVIIIIAIVSITAVSRMSGRSSFELYALQDQVISVVRQVQVNSMQANLGSSFPQDQEDPQLDRANFQLVANGNCLGSGNACPYSEGDAPRSDRIFEKKYQFRYQTNLEHNMLEFDPFGSPSLAVPATVGIEISEQANPGNRVWVCINEQGFVSAEIGGCG